MKKNGAKFIETDSQRICTFRIKFKMVVIIS
nr:MAG TPA: hypothetical protein [Caudoviricetes sp.]